ncbi:MAG: phosphogluconate dehydratase [Proteobacteria bacterium]|nr:phosphogluconate dehydratase [Pseudomonadota bacterium]
MTNRLNATVAEVTERIVARSSGSRGDYLRLIDDAMAAQPSREQLSCGNLAHAFAACSEDDKTSIRLMNAANIGIVTAYNDMLSAHQPYADYPEKLKQYIRAMGSTAQVAGGVPAMCDGVTQGLPGMELSLFSRDTIAQATVIALSHQMFDGVVCLGICDKIVPGLLMGALRFGHLPMMFVPAGPMPSGIANAEKARVRQLFAQGEIGRDELLAAEAASYHSAGTCTFYGTANTNQLLMEAMGLQLPGGSFVNPGSSLREVLTKTAAEHITRVTRQAGNLRPLGRVLDERSFVNAVVALLASGGSTNHSIHLIAMARAAGIIINWDDFNELSGVTPLLCRIYPNGQADINHFQAAGGTSYLFSELFRHGLMHIDAQTMWGDSLADYTQEPVLVGDQLHWRSGAEESLDKAVLTSAEEPFDSEGGLRLLTGNLGRGVIKVSAVAEEHRQVSAPAVVIDAQDQLKAKFDAGELDRDCIVVVRFQGPSANGMPELHKLTPILGSLQDRGFAVALVTDGRMSGASGKVPAAIHISPEASVGGPLAYIRDGDLISLDAVAGRLECQVDKGEWCERQRTHSTVVSSLGIGREYFEVFRQSVSSAEEGASVLWPAQNQVREDAC